jgi:protein-S-isoprenylcysteine O-methyltransferase Ste14
MLGIGQIAYTDSASMSALMVGSVAFAGAVIATRVTNRREGGGTRDRLSLAGAIVQGVAIGLSAITARVGAPDDWRNAAEVALLMAAAVAVFIWSARTMGQNWAIVARTRGDHELVTTGPFALVRNPIYVAMALFLLAVAMATHHERALLFTLPLFAIGTLIRTSIEERLLRAQFGAAYDTYAARVKRFIPGVV